MTTVQVRLEAGEHQPGGEVRGRVAVVADQRARGLEVRLGFVERTSDYTERPIEVSGGRIAEGDLVAGSELPFSIQLPADALPAAAGRSSRIGWEVEAKVDVPRRPDIKVSEKVRVVGDAVSGPVADPPGISRKEPRHRPPKLARTPGAILGWALLVMGGLLLAIALAIGALDGDIEAGLAFGAIGGLVALAGFALLSFLRPRKAQGLDLTVDRPVVRRGANVTCRASIAADPDVSVGLVCVELHDEEDESVDADGNRTTSRQTRQNRIHEDWKPVSGGVGQSISFTVPEDLPYSYLGRCASYTWYVVARRKRRVGSEQTEVPISVEP